MSQKKVAILVYVTQQEKADLEAAAAADDRVLSQFCRRLLLRALYG